MDQEHLQKRDGKSVLLILASLILLFILVSCSSSGSPPASTGSTANVGAGNASAATTTPATTSPASTPAQQSQQPAPTSSPPAPTSLPSTPTPTSTAIPNITGNYTGSFTRSGESGSSPMDIQIAQSGSALSGMTDESGTKYSDTGAITSIGFSISENGMVNLLGTVVGPGHLSGTWGPNGASGTWDVSLVPTVAGNYKGTRYGQGQVSMQMQLTQIGSILSGTTNEDGAMYQDSGSIGANGQLQIAESGSIGTIDLSGSIVRSIVAQIQLSGTWTLGKYSGTWNVSAILMNR